MYHAVTILIRMEPNESEIYPDILLTLDTKKADRYTNDILALKRGDKIGFNATIKSLGD